MVYSYGGRIDNDSNAITKIDEENRTAETKGYINGEYVEFSGGGGGSSDFSTVDVTVSIPNNLEELCILYLIYTDSINDILLSNANFEVSTETSLNVVLYKGHSYVGVMDSNGDYYDITKVSVTGDIEILGDAGDWGLHITGDCTITIS